MPDKPGTPRRAFLRNAALGIGAAVQAPAQTTPAPSSGPEIGYPRVFTGPQLKMIAFPLGGIGAGSLSLGGRGQLRDWEIFNRAQKGNAPQYAFASVWAREGDGKAVARVLEARILPPYEGPSGLGFASVPGLP